MIIADVYNSLQVGLRCFEKIYGTETHLILQVVDYWISVERKLLAATSELAAARAELKAANEKLDYVHAMGLRFGMMESTDKPEPYLAHVWTDDCSQTRIFNEWSESIGWEDQLKAVTEQRDALQSASEYLNRRNGELTEQRDTLAEAITQYLPYVPDMQLNPLLMLAARHSDANIKAWALREALHP